MDPNPDNWKLQDWVFYCMYAGGVLMMQWLRDMFGRTCAHCQGRKPLFTHCCDRCWKLYHRTDNDEY